MSSFIHLHNHSDFSLLEAAQSVTAIIDRASELSMNAIAITEKGNLFSMIDFYKYAKNKNIKPIIGCEINIADDLKIYNKSMRSYHLVLLAKNNEGYLGYLKSKNELPIIDKSILQEFSPGLIAMSGGLTGEIMHYASNDDYTKTKNVALEYYNIFHDNFYFEIQNHKISKQITINSMLADLSKELSIPLVATNNTYYTLKEDSDSCDVIRCIGTGHNINDPNRIQAQSTEYYIKSSEETHKLFKDYPEALENTVKIAESCNIDIPMGELFLPKFPISDSAQSTTADEFLKELCHNNISKKYNKETPEIMKRLDYELDIIYKMGFSNYFLITQDFVQYAKDNNIPVGPGRGSAVGSLVSYLIGITGLDPLKYNLLFERFLNPDRVSMPDIDIDFCIEGREKIINYIKEKYGKESVAQIITFGSMKAKSVIRDVGRVLGMPYMDVDKIAKMIPDDLKMTIQNFHPMAKNQI